MQDLTIEMDPYLKNFIDNRNLSKSTEMIYLGRIKSFCQFFGKTPSQLIEEILNESGIKIEGYFQDYIENLKKRGQSSNTIINKVDTVKAFFNEFKINTENINRIISTETDNLTYNKIISLDQIREALELSNLRDKAVILLHLSSGMEATELRYLTYGDFISSVEEYIDLKSENVFNIEEIAYKLLKMDDLVGVWKIEKHRTNRPYVAFSTSESTKAILSYLIDRERNNKPIKSLEDPLFVNSQNQALKKSAHGSIFKRVNNRVHFGYLTKKRRFFSSTMLRKYFKNTLFSSGVDETVVNEFLGQNLDKTIDYHSKDETRRLKEKYIDSADVLFVQKSKIETKFVASEEYKMLITKLNEKDKELAEIKEYLKQIKQVMNLKDV